MASLLHFDFTAGPGAVAVAHLDRQARVLLLDDSNFHHYRCRMSFRSWGGWFRRTPAQLPVPHVGRWHVVVDLAGRAGHVRVQFQLMEAA